MSLDKKHILNPVRIFSSRVFFLLLVLSNFDLSGQVYYYEINPEITRAYELAENLQLDYARAYCDSLKDLQPGNLLVHHVENYTDFYHCFITEEEQAYTSLVLNKSSRLSAIAQGSKTSPYYRFSRAEILLQWALVELKHKKYISALFDINKATKLLEENKRLFPEFALNNKSLSVIHALVGTIPDTYKKPLSWFSSFEGTIDEGYEEINEITCDVGSDDLFYKEIYVIKALIELHVVNDKAAAWETTSSTLLDVKSSPLLTFITSNIAHRTHDNDVAISILEQRKNSKGSLPFYYLNFLEGSYRLNNLEEGASIHLKKYVKYFRGKNYIKEAYMKLAWYEYAVNNDSQAFFQYLTRCETEGEAITDEDKYALRFAERRELPNRGFLRARLLFDGRYYDRALDELTKTENTLKNEEKPEFQYRKGRIYFELKQYDQAILAFASVINQQVKNEDFYLSSLYYTGLSYENNGQPDEAKMFYSKALEVNSGAYKTSLHQKSKAGLLRLK